MISTATLTLIFQAVLVLCIVQLLLYVLKLFQTRWKLQKIINDLKMTEVPGYESHPLWGHLHLLPSDERKRLDALVDLTMKTPADGHGMFPFWMGPFTCLLTMSGPEYIKACVANADYKDNFVYDWFKPWIGNGLLVLGGQKWFRHRRLLTPAFHFEILKPYLDIFSDSAEILLDKFAASEGKPVEIFKPIGLFTLDSLLKCSFSYQSNCQLQGENDYIKAVYEITEIINSRVLKIHFMNDFIFNWSPTGRRFYKLCKLVHDKSRETISRRRVEIKVSGEKVQGERGKYLDFLDILLAARDEDGNGMDEEEIREEVDTFMFEGHDTTGCAIPWLLYNLAKHPEYQHKCRQEVDKLLQEKGQDRLTWEDMSRLPYLTMCIKESLRMYPPVQTIMTKMVKDVKLPNDAVVPKGTTVLCSIIGLHYSPNIWPNPKEYNPERFTPENVKLRHTHAFLPFSAGPRNCIGQHFAMNEIKIVAAKTLHRFNFDVDPDRSPIWIQRMVIRPWDGIYLRFTPTGN